MKWLAYIVIAVLVMEVFAMTIKGIRGPSKNPWVGGNGCNLIGGKNRLNCCNAHDKAYKEGGWVIARLKADLNLFGCIVKQGGFSAVFVAPVMLIGTRSFGMWAFQYGKKREIKE